MFVTVFYAIYNVRTGTLSFCNAGHNPPLIVHADGGVDELPFSDNIVVGAFADIDFHEHSMQLQHGDTLMMFTDGVNEAWDASHNEFGMERFRQVLADNASYGSRQIIDAVSRALNSFAGNAEQSDDITMLTVKRI